MGEDDRLLTATQVLKLTGYKSRSTLWRRVKAGNFPKPKALGSNTTRWSSKEINNWIKSLPSVSYGKADESRNDN